MALINANDAVALFQYRKRYEVTCDMALINANDAVALFQYRKRYEVTCDAANAVPGRRSAAGFNTASGMRSHVTQWCSV